MLYIIYPQIWSLVFFLPSIHSPSLVNNTQFSFELTFWLIWVELTSFANFRNWRVTQEWSCNMFIPLDRMNIQQSHGPSQVLWGQRSSALKIFFKFLGRTHILSSLVPYQENISLLLLETSLLSVGKNLAKH